MEASEADLDLEPGIEPGVSAPETAVDSESVLDRIKRRRDGQEDFLTVDIPSWDGDLRAKYKVLERQRVEQMIRRIRARANGAAHSGVEADCDFLIEACVEVRGYDVESDTEFHISDGYTMDLAQALDPKYPKGHPMEGDTIPIHNERELVVYLVKWNDIALSAHGQVVAKWMQTLKRPIEDPS